MPPVEHPTYHPRDAIAIGVNGALLFGGFGAIFAGIQNTLARQNVGAKGFITRFGGTTALFTAMGGSYGFTKTFSANIRQKEDSWNTAIGGFFAGSMVGLRMRTYPAVLGWGLGLAVVSGAFDYTGGKITGYEKDPNVDEIDRKTFLRKNRRKPIEETVAELGEGRGIYGPGYEQRRQQRILEKYGIDVSNVPSAH